MTATILAPPTLPPALELRAGDLLVGWIHGDLVRFRGFGSQRGAAYAAAVAHQAMLRRLARGHRAPVSAMESDDDAVRRRSDHANANGRSVASVLRSSVDGIGGGDSGEFAFEIRVPPPIDELRMRGMAYVMFRALRSSGADWPLVRPAAPEALTALAQRAQRSARAATQRWGAQLAQRFGSFVARLAGVRRSATLGLTLLLATGVAKESEAAAEGARS